MSPFLRHCTTLDALRCHAHKADTGEPCKAFAITGGKVCVYHGGAVPSVRAAALARLEAVVLGTVTRLVQLRDQSADLSVSMRASADLLDRAGYSAQRQLKLSGDSDAPLEIIISRGNVDPPKPDPALES